MLMFLPRIFVLRGRAPLFASQLLAAAELLQRLHGRLGLLAGLDASGVVRCQYLRRAVLGGNFKGSLRVV